MEKFLLFHFVGYNSKLNEETLTDRVDIKLIDTDYDSALIRARDIVVRNAWFLIEVTEFHKKDN